MTGHEARRRDEESCVSPSPYLADIGVLTLVPCEWESFWLSRHQILTRLAKYFHVVWCTPAPWWREAWLRSGRQGGGGEMVSLPLDLPSIVLKGGFHKWVGRISWLVGPNDNAYGERINSCSLEDARRSSSISGVLTLHLR